MKCKRIALKGIRGVQKTLDLDLDGKSCLIYGENGSGKSTITDGIEWLIWNRIDHLISEEIGKGGTSAIRNLSLLKSEEAEVTLEFDTGEVIKKTLNDKLQENTAVSNVSLDDYVIVSREERIILRYQELISFVIGKKKDRLNAFSDMIGLGILSDYRTTINKIRGKLKTEIRVKDFSNRRSQHQSTLLSLLNQNAPDEGAYLQAINILLAKLPKQLKCESIDKLDHVLSNIPDSSGEAERRLKLQKISDNTFDLIRRIGLLETDYLNYYKKFNDILSDKEKAAALKLSQFLNSGLKIITDEPKDKCPFCLQGIPHHELHKSVNKRIDDIKYFQRESTELSTLKSGIEFILKEIHGVVAVLNGLDGHNNLKTEIINLESVLASYDSNLKIALTDSIVLAEPVNLSFDTASIKVIADTMETELKSALPTDTSGREVRDAILRSREAFQNIQKLAEEETGFTIQRDAFETLYSEFVARQKTAVDSFMALLTIEINQYYSFMNPGEAINSFEFQLMEKEDELVGLTISHKFHSTTIVPPQKYLSESHLNSFGLALFLTTVKLRNKRNQFFILDDVISSFDSNHRKRFAELLIQKFADYQILVLTHESDWFAYFRELAKGRGWKIEAINSNTAEGTHFISPTGNRRQKIIDRMGASDLDGIGNDIRKYLEHQLKNVGAHVDVLMPYRDNHTNEHRMANELLQDLIRHVKKQPIGLVATPIIGRLLSSTFITNVDSHDSSINVAAGDIRAIWDDINALEDVFFCNNCHQSVSIKNYDNASKKIRCNCGTKEIEWKE